MNEKLILSVLSPERRLVENVEVSEVTLTGSEGQIQILPGHAAMIGTLQTGLFHYVEKNHQQRSGIISSGFFEVKDGHVAVTAETVEMKQEINLSRAKTAQLKAEEALKDPSLDEHKFRKYQLKLQRALIRQQLASTSES